MIDKSALKPFDKEAYKRGVPAVVRFYDELHRALEVSEKIDVAGDHTVLISDGGKLCWLFVTEDDLLMLDVGSEPEQQEEEDIITLRWTGHGPQTITGFPSIDWEQRTWEMYTKMIHAALVNRERGEIALDSFARCASMYVSAYRKEMEEKK